MLSLNQIKSKQRSILIGSVVGFVGLLVFGLYISDPNKGKPTAMEEEIEKKNEVKKNFTSRGSDSVSPQEVWIARSEDRMVSTENELNKLKKDLENMKKMYEAETKKNKDMTNNLPPPVQGQGSAVYPAVPKAPVSPSQLQVSSEESVEVASNQSGNPKLFPTVQPHTAPPSPFKSGGTTTGKGPVVDNNKGMYVMEIETTEDSDGGAEHKSKLKNISHYMPAGSFAKAILLQGVDAPTGGLSKTNPIPVLLRIVDLGQLPNFFKTGIKNCHATGAAIGNISDERVYIRTELLSCVLTNGDVVEVKIDGNVAGEDGKTGIRGKLVSKQGSMIAKAALAGLASGMGDAVESQYTTQQTSALGTVETIDGDKVIEAGLAKGFGNSMDKIAEFWIARANETYPIIEVGPKRIVELVATNGVDFGTDITDKVRMEPN